MEIWRTQACLTKCRLLVDILVVTLWIGSLLAVHALVKPRRQGFFCEDNSIRYPYLDSTVSNQVIVTMTLAAPVAVIFLTELLVRTCLRVHTSSSRRSTSARMTAQPTLRDVVMVYLGYFWGYLVLTMIVLVLKATTGQLRPHFLAVCRPDVDWVTCRGYVSEYNCTNTERSERDVDTARESFPSGHSAYAMFLALFLILYMEARLRTRHFRLLKLTSYAVLMLYALWCSVTRVSDNMHHMGDVTAGGLLGLLLAVLTFQRAAIHCLRTSTPTRQDLEANTNHSYHDNHKSTVTITADSVNDNVDDDEEEDDDGSLSNLETEAPGTPTPLLSNGIRSHAAGSTDLKAAPFTLEGNKHKFARKTKSSQY